MAFPGERGRFTGIAAFNLPSTPRLQHAPTDSTESADQTKAAYTSYSLMGFNDGIPEYGIHHLLWPNEIAEKMRPFLLGMIDCMLVDGMDYVIEGEAMLPPLIAELVEKHPGKVRAVFVGYTKIDVADKVALVKKHADGENDWLTSKSDEYIKDHVGNMVAYSKMIKEACEKHGLPYFDTSDDFPGAIEAATDFLVRDLS